MDVIHLLLLFLVHISSGVFLVWMHKIDISYGSWGLIFIWGGLCNDNYIIYLGRTWGDFFLHNMVKLWIVVRTSWSVDVMYVLVV